jgi:hypothetical protein
LAFEHIGDCFPRAEERAHNCNPPRLLELSGRGFHYSFTDRTACVRDQNFNRAKLPPHFAKACSDLLCVGDVRRNCERVGSNFSGKFAYEVSRTREHSDATALGNKFADQRGSKSGTYSRDNRHTLMPLISHIIYFSHSR